MEGPLELEFRHCGVGGAPSSVGAAELVWQGWFWGDEPKVWALGSTSVYCMKGAGNRLPTVYEADSRVLEEHPYPTQAPPILCLGLMQRLSKPG